MAERVPKPILPDGSFESERWEVTMNVIARLLGVSRCGDGWTANCPAHDDRHSSLSVHHRDGRWLVKCHAGCAWQEIVAALGLNAGDLFDDGREMEGGGSISANNRATVQPGPDSLATGGAGHFSKTSPPPAVGLTIEQYAAAKRIPVEF